MQQTATSSESARRCTGPRTREGKQKSSQNSTKHGCCSKRLLLPDENPEDWEALKAGWLQSYDVTNPAYEFLVLEAAQAQWQQIRAQHAFDAVQYDIYEEQPDCTLWTEVHHKLYSRFQRYLTTAQNAFHRAFQQVERLRRTQIKEQEVAFKQDLDIRRFALREEKTLHEIALIQVKTDYANTKMAAPRSPSSATPTP